MGTEISFPRNRTVSSCDEGMTQRLQNNFHALHFHHVHGENVKLLKNGSVACRSEGFCKGIAFSDRPVLVGEPVYIKFLEISSNWSGALRIGFTMNDPVSMKSKLPRYACPDLTSSNGNWAKAIAERMAKKDSVLYYYVDQNGDVHYGIDAEEHGVFFGGVNTSGKLWAVFDIYGNTVAVELIDRLPVNEEFYSNTFLNNITTLTRNSETQNSTSVLTSDLKCCLLFYPVHGKSVELKANRTIASRKTGSINCSLAYVFTEEPLKLGEEIFFKVLKTSVVSDNDLIYGVTSCNPSTLNPSDLPENADDLLDRPEYWIVRNSSDYFEENDILIFRITLEGEVIVIRNSDNSNSSIFHVDPTQPLWLFFNITGMISEICSLGIGKGGVSNLVNDLASKLKSMSVSLPERDQDQRIKPSTSGQQAYSECVICYEEPVNCALYRCGHMCMCYGCALKMWQPTSNVYCPICRDLIQDVIKIYR